MFNHKLKDAARTMIAGGVDPKYVKRTVQELRDHYEDLKSNLLKSGLSEAEASREAEQKIGNLHDIAVEATNKNELQSWISTHPKTTFIGGPFLAFVLTTAALIGVVFILTLVLKPDELFTFPYPLWFVAFMNLLAFTNMYVIPGLLAATFVFIARDRLTPKNLVVASVVISAFLTSLLAWRVVFPEGPGESGQFVATFHVFGFRPRFPREGGFMGFGFDLGALMMSLFRIGLAAGIAAVVWRLLGDRSWFAENHKSS